MWCPNCKTEYREGITKCADCGAMLVEEDPNEAEELLKEKEFEERVKAAKASFEADGDLLSKESDDLNANEDSLSEVIDNHYVKIADKYRDNSTTATTLILLSIAFISFLLLSKFEIIPLQYNIFVWSIFMVICVAILIYGISLVKKSAKLKELIPEEEKKISEINSWLSENITNAEIEDLIDDSISDGENDLIIVEKIHNKAKENFSDADDSLLIMLCEEYYEENFQ